MNRLIATARSVVHRAWRRAVRSSLDRGDRRVMLGLSLDVPAGVLNPAHFPSSRFLGHMVSRLDLRGLRVADLGCGSGVLGLLAAKSGALVTAIDVNPNAVLCARGNASRNGLADRVTVIESDVFDAVPNDLRFDYIVTNPPFYPREPINAADLAFAAGSRNEFFAKLAGQIRGRMTEGGRLILVHSSDVEFDPIHELLAAQGLVARNTTRKRSLFETLTIREFALDPASTRRG